MSYLEKDIEYAYRDMMVNKGFILIGQQVRIPTGVIDLILYDTHWDRPIIVEVKRGRTPASVVSQLYGYMGYVQHHIDGARDDEPFYKELSRSDMAGKPIGIIVAEELDDRTNRAIYYGPDIVFTKYAIKNGKIVFPTGLDYSPSDFRNKYIDPALDRLLNLTDKAVRDEKLHTDRRQTLNVGGSYDRILFTDLESNNNIIWKAKK